jgi:hypothetical protein
VRVLRVCDFDLGSVALLVLEIRTESWFYKNLQQGLLQDLLLSKGT